MAPGWFALTCAGTTFRATVTVFAALALALIFGGHVNPPSLLAIIADGLSLLQRGGAAPRTPG